MKFRRKHRHRETEIFTDSLNDILFILLMFFLITTTMANPNMIKVNNPSATKDTKGRQNVIVTIDKDQKFYIAQKQVPINSLDSALHAEIAKWKKILDTPTVVVNGDSAAMYGEIFRIVRMAKRDSVKVFFNVRQ
jgi:biopolymer transport protein ExbD